MRRLIISLSAVLSWGTEGSGRSRGEKILPTLLFHFSVWTSFFGPFGSLGKSSNCLLKSVTMVELQNGLASLFIDHPLLLLFCGLFTHGK